MPNYENGKIYKIVDNLTGQQYIGSTTQTLAQRIVSHINQFKNREIDISSHCCTSYEILKNDDYYIVLIENYSCDSKEELLTRERYFIESMECVNKVIPTRTRKQYLVENKIKVTEQRKQYRLENKELLSEKSKQYRNNNLETIAIEQKLYYENHKTDLNEKKKAFYQTNKDKILQDKLQQCICMCGATYAKAGKSRHEKTKKHQNYVQNNLI